jgi:RimJ/RimL family protein N-acetyltransferase
MLDGQRETQKARRKTAEDAENSVMSVRTVTLEGNAVRLEPIRMEHWKELWEVARDAAEDIFRWIPYPMRTPEDFEQWADKALAERQSGESLVFVTVERASGRLIGSTRFMNIDRANQACRD